LFGQNKSTIEIGSNDEDEDIMVKIFAFYIYKKWSLNFVKKIKSIRYDILNSTIKNDELNKYIDEVIKGYLCVTNILKNILNFFLF
jgi:hypothetical protein